MLLRNVFKKKETSRELRYFGTVIDRNGIERLVPLSEREISEKVETCQYGIVLREEGCIRFKFRE